MKKCSYCHTENKDQSTHCYKCGLPLAHLSGIPPTKRKKPRRAWLLLPVILLIATGIVTYFIVTGNRDDNYVNLGLSVKWSKYNIGTTDEKDPGKYFGVPTSINISNPSLVRVPRSDDDYGKIINSLIKTYDSSARLPYIWELEDLVYKCRWEREGNGYRVIGPNGNSIYLPLTGRYYGDKYLKDSLGIYIIDNFRHGEYNDELSKYLEFGSSVKIVDPRVDKYGICIEDSYLAIRPVKY